MRSFLSSSLGPRLWYGTSFALSRASHVLTAAVTALLLGAPYSASPSSRPEGFLSSIIIHMVPIVFFKLQSILYGFYEQLYFILLPAVIEIYALFSEVGL